MNRSIVRSFTPVKISDSGRFIIDIRFMGKGLMENADQRWKGQTNGYI
jgi:hypothetical protein